MVRNFEALDAFIVANLASTLAIIVAEIVLLWFFIDMLSFEQGIIVSVIFTMIVWIGTFLTVKKYHTHSPFRVMSYERLEQLENK